MDLQLSVRYKISLDGDELRLLSKAMRGKLETEVEKKKALELQEKLMSDKHGLLHQLEQEAFKTIDNISKAKG